MLECKPAAGRQRAAVRGFRDWRFQFGQRTQAICCRSGARQTRRAAHQRSSGLEAGDDREQQADEDRPTDMPGLERPDTVDQNEDHRDAGEKLRRRAGRGAKKAEATADRGHLHRGFGGRIQGARNLPEYHQVPMRIEPVQRGLAQARGRSDRGGDRAVRTARL